MTQTGFRIAGFSRRPFDTGGSATCRRAGPQRRDRRSRGSPENGTGRAVLIALACAACLLSACQSGGAGGTEPRQNCAMVGSTCELERPLGSTKG